MGAPMVYDDAFGLLSPNLAKEMPVKPNSLIQKLTETTMVPPSDKSRRSFVVLPRLFLSTTF
jgi:hypothetical protein